MTQVLHEQLFYFPFFCYLLSNSNILQMTIISHFLLLKALSDFAHNPFSKQYAKLYKNIAAFKIQLLHPVLKQISHLPTTLSCTSTHVQQC